MSKKPIRGILVDDEELLLDLYHQSLEFNGIELFCFSSASEALKALDDFKGAIDFIMSDYEMPYINGLEFFSMLPEPYLKHTMCILHSGSLRRFKPPVNIEHFHFLDKPMNLDDLSVYIAVEVTKIRLANPENEVDQNPKNDNGSHSDDEGQK